MNTYKYSARNNDLRVYVGSIDRRNERKIGYKYDVLKHYRYNHERNIINHLKAKGSPTYEVVNQDIAVIITKRPISFDEAVYPIAIPDDSEYHEDKLTYLNTAGWGSNSKGSLGGLMYLPHLMVKYSVDDDDRYNEMMSK